jgi:hypothetical protein
VQNLISTLPVEDQTKPTKRAGPARSTKGNNFSLDAEYKKNNKTCAVLSRFLAVLPPPQVLPQSAHLLGRAFCPSIPTIRAAPPILELLVAPVLDPFKNQARPGLPFLQKISVSTA